MNAADFDTLVGLIRPLRPPRPSIHLVSDGGRVQRRLRRAGLSRAARRMAARPSTPHFALPPPAVLRGALLVLRLLGHHHAESARSPRSTSTYLHRELAMLAAALGERRQVVQYHWGGGTPTYLSLVADRGAPGRRAAATSTSRTAPRWRSRSIRGSRPWSSSRCLRELGFNRLSLGVQDFTPEVQEAVNRIQSESLTRTLFDAARGLGLRVDQHRSDLRPAAADARLVRHTPSTPSWRCGPTASPSTPTRTCRGFAATRSTSNPADLPPAERKIELFVEAIERFRAAGYEQIGMDHFALPTDELAVASPPAGCTATSWATRRARRPTCWRPACRASATWAARSRRTRRSCPTTTRRSMPDASRSSAATGSTPTITSAASSSPN